MNDDLLIKVGKSVIDSFFKRSEKEAIDDAELLPLVKEVINGIGLHASDTKIVKDSLFRFARKKYTDLCRTHQIEDGDKEDRQYENEEYFEYVYENEEHPD